MNLSILMNQAIRNRMAELNTAMPGKVVAYDFETQKASVVPTILRQYADGRKEAFPQINDVPVVFLRAGGASLTFPVREGDPVLLIFSARSLDLWMNGGAEPGDRRMHSLNDAIAIPGLIPFTAGSMAKNNDDVLLTYDGSEVELKPEGKIVMRSQLVTIESPEVRMTGDLRVRGDIYDLDSEYGAFNRIRTVYNTHTHPENDDGGPTSPPNQLLGEV